MKHRVKSPFPRTTPAGGTVIDEVCTCGHKRSAHDDTVAYGHGRCHMQKTCPCQKFSFAERLFDVAKTCPDACSKGCIAIPCLKGYAP